MTIVPFPPRGGSAPSATDLNGFLQSSAAFEALWLRLETLHADLQGIMRQANGTHGRAVAATIGADIIVEHARLSADFLERGIGCAERAAGLAADYDVFSLVRLDALGTGLDCLLRIVPFAADAIDRQHANVPLDEMRATAQRVRFEILRTANAGVLVETIENECHRDIAIRVVETAMIGMEAVADLFRAIDRVGNIAASGIDGARTDDAVARVLDYTALAVNRLAFYRSAVDLLGGIGEPACAMTSLF